MLFLRPSDVVVTKRQFKMGLKVIPADTAGIVVGEESARRVQVQFEVGDNGITETILCFRTNLRLVP